MFERYKVPIVIALTILGLIVLILLIGVAYGYVNVSRRMLQYERVKVNVDSQLQTEVNTDQ